VFEVSIDAWMLMLEEGRPPELRDLYAQGANLVDRFIPSGTEGKYCFLAARHRDRELSLVVEQRYSPSTSGFRSGVLLVPETATLFLGAGERLLAYRLDPPARLWEDNAEVGFWGWARHGNVIVMSAELELAAYGIAGEKLWTTFVEPPWSYSVRDSQLVVDVMGTVSRFPLRTGPSTL
jgi:hypothetical protein